MVAPRESAALAKRLIAETIGKQELQAADLTIHADRGTSMRSKLVAQFLADLGVTKTHSRPQVSNDNPFSESQFKTLKYRPEFPARFGSQEHATAFCRGFFPWYNRAHHHSGLALLTPHQVHYGLVDAVLAERQTALDAAFTRHPERFSKPPMVARPPAKVWINPPDPQPPAGSPPSKNKKTNSGAGSARATTLSAR